MTPKTCPDCGRRRHDGACILADADAPPPEAIEAAVVWWRTLFYGILDHARELLSLRPRR